MSGSQHRAGSGKQSWRQGSKTAGPDAGSRRAGRWYLTLLLIGLLAVFLWYVFRPVRGQRHLVAVPIWATDRLTVPPIPYVREDIDAFQGLEDLTFHDASQFQDADSFDGLDGKLREWVAGETDVLVVYVAAHGISHEGRPVLVCSDYARTASRGRYEVGNLLSKLAANPAKLKLLILDSGRLDYDPRLGMVVNEFGRLVEQNLAQMEKQDLWVLLPNTSLQVSAVSHLGRHTVFGRGVADALSGAADRSAFGDKNDRYVSLAELYNFVTQRCERWYGTAGDATQTPILMQAGTGVVQPGGVPIGKTYRLTYVKQKEPDDEEEAEDAEETDEDESEESEKSESDSTSQAHSIPWFGRATGLAILQAETKTEASEAKPAEPPPPENAAAKPSEEADGQAADAKPSAEAPIDAPTAKPPAAPAKEETKSQPAEAPVADPDESDAEDLLRPLRDALQEAWTLRDRLQLRQVAGGLSPIDFAPHIWREVNATLLYFERRCRAGRPVDSVEPADEEYRKDAAQHLSDLNALVGDLAQLVTSMETGAQPQRRDIASVGDRLIAAWRRYASGPKPEMDRALRESPDILRSARQAARGLRDRIFRAPYFVAWYARATVDAPPTVLARYRTDIGKYLDDLLVGQNELRGLERSLDPSEGNLLLRDFIEHQQALAAAERRLQDGLLQPLEDAALAKLSEPIQQLHAEDLLSTPLLRAGSRRRLLEGLLRAEAVPQADGSARRREELGFQLSPEEWRRLQHRVALEAKLIRFVDADQAVRLERQLGDVTSLITERENGPQVEEDLWRVFREIGKMLREFYVGLPTADVGEQGLQLVDARDAVRVGDAYPFPAFRIVLNRPAELKLAVDERRFALDHTSPTTFHVTLSATQRFLLDTRLSLSYDENLIDVASLPDEDEREPERGWFSKRLSWRVTPRPRVTSEEGSQTSLTVIARYQGGEETAAIDFALPQPNRVDLFFSRLGTSTYQGGPQDTINLDLLANGATSFQASLVNQHNKAKKIEVNLYAIAPQIGARAAVGRLDEDIRRSVYDKEKSLFSQVELVATTAKPLELPPADLTQETRQHVPVDFAPPGGSAPPVPVGGQPGTKPKPAAPPPEPKPIHGLVCEISNVERPAERRVLWIELTPLSPREYLDVEAGFDQGKEELVVRVQAKLDADGRPMLSPGREVEIVWDPAGALIPEGAQMQLAGTLTRNSPPVELRAEVPADEKDRYIRLGVDGYPRAFVYRVNCREARRNPTMIQATDLGREETAVRIESVSAMGQNRVYHYLPFTPPPPAEGDQGDQVEHFAQEPQQPAIFRAPCGDLVVNLQVDTPIDAFVQMDDRIELTLRENRRQRLRYSARQMAAQLVKTGARGLVEFETIIGDHVLALSPGALENVQTVIDTDVITAVGEASDSVLIQLDGDDPNVDDVAFPPRVPKDSKVKIRVRVRDRYGVTEVLYGFSEDGTDKLTAEATKRKLIEPIERDGLLYFDLEVDVAGLAIGPQKFLLKVVDRVGHESELDSQPFMIIDPEAMPATGEIRGRITFGSAAVNGNLFDLTIEGPSVPPRRVKVARSGTFVIPNLPAGAYTLTAKGSAQGRDASGELKDVTPWDPQKKQSVTLSVQHGENE